MHAAACLAHAVWRAFMRARACRKGEGILKAAAPVAAGVALVVAHGEAPEYTREAKRMRQMAAQSQQKHQVGGWWSVQAGRSGLGGRAGACRRPPSAR